MARQDPYDEYPEEQPDPYRTKVLDDLAPNTGIGAGVNVPAPAPAGGYDLEKFRNAWYGKGDVNNIQGWLDQNKAFTTGVTLKGEKAYDPTGKFIADLVGNYTGAPTSDRTAIFLDGIGSNGKPRTRTDDTGGTPRATPIDPKKPGLNVVDSGHGKGVLDIRTNPPGGVPVAPTGPAGPSPAANDFLTKIREMILARLTTLNSQGDPSDSPEVKQPLDAAARMAERVRRQRQDASAERLYADGVGDSGAMDAEIGRGYEDMSSDLSGVSSELVGRVMSERRNELQNLMNMALQSGDAESARALQMQMAQLDAQIRREQLKESARQANQNDKYRYKTLDEQRRQWNDEFGWQQNRGYNDDYWRRIMLGLG